MVNNIFDDSTRAIQQLKNDKHTLLEGYVTEYLFEEQFLANKDTLYTKGWWMVNANERNIFFIVKDILNDLDVEIINKIKLPDECWQVNLVGYKWIFIKDNLKLELNGFLKLTGLKALRTNLIASNETRNVERQKNSIDFFVQKNLIKKIATERLFANNFLTVYFKGMVNIDCFTKSKNGFLNVIEIKYKYESRDNCFGINVGQMNMFKYFYELGFKINHFILYNHKKDMNISIFGFLKLTDKKYWLFGTLEKLNENEIGIAPERTSVSGGFKQPYYKLKKENIKRRFLLNV